MGKNDTKSSMLVSSFIHSKIDETGNKWQKMRQFIEAIIELGEDCENTRTYLLPESHKHIKQNVFVTFFNKDGERISGNWTGRTLRQNVGGCPYDCDINFEHHPDFDWQKTPYIKDKDFCPAFEDSTIPHYLWGHCMAIQNIARIRVGVRYMTVNPNAKFAEWDTETGIQFDILNMDSYEVSKTTYTIRKD